MEQQRSTKFLRHRKFLLALPILVIPFITLAFWALGGGKGSDAQKAQGNTKTGLNLELPGANIKDDKSVDKLGYYEKAASDSARLRELMKNDPYFNKHVDEEDTLPKEASEDNSVTSSSSYSTKQGLNSPNNNGKYKDPNEEKVYQKLAQLNTALNDASTGKNLKDESSQPSNNQQAMQTGDVDRLEQMMQAMNNNGGNSEDPEMKQLNSMLEKILDIQHPDRIKENLKDRSLQNKGEVFVVSKETDKTSVSLMDTAKQKTMQDATNGFFGISNEKVDGETHNGIEAVVHETQTLVNGAVVKIRLLNDIY